MAVLFPVFQLTFKQVVVPVAVVVVDPFRGEALIEVALQALLQVQGMLMLMQVLQQVQQRRLCQRVQNHRHVQYLPKEQLWLRQSLQLRY